MLKFIKLTGAGQKPDSYGAPAYFRTDQILSVRGLWVGPLHISPPSKKGFWRKEQEQPKTPPRKMIGEIWTGDGAQKVMQHPDEIMKHVGFEVVDLTVPISTTQEQQAFMDRAKQIPHQPGVPVEQVASKDLVPAKIK